MKKIVLFTVLVVLLQTFVYAAPSSWAQEEVSQAESAGLVPNDLRGDYTAQCTREEFCRLAVALVEKRMGSGVDEILSARGITMDAAAFSDTDSREISAAYELGIVNGVGNDRFDPDGLITREQAAVMLMRTSNILGYTAGSSLLSFADRNEFSDYAVKGIDFASSAGLMKGVGKNRFDPRGYYTREMAYITMLRLYGSVTASDGAAVDTAMNAEEIFKKCSSAVVYISIYNVDGKKTASGSGFFIETDGTLVTNYHVIENAASAEIRMTDGKTAKISGVIGCSEEKDVAILKADISGVPTLTMGDSDSVSGGQRVYAIGSPLGLENSISEGIVSNPYREEIGGIQITAAISSGSSGGALINDRGEVVGVTFAGIEGGQSLNFAVPINEVKKLERTAAVSFSDMFSVRAQAEYEKRAEMFEDVYLENEPNNTVAASDMLKNGNSVSGSISGSDMDVFTFNCPSNGTARVYLISESYYAPALVLAAAPYGKSSGSDLVYAYGGYIKNGDIYCMILEYPISSAGDYSMYITSKNKTMFSDVEYLFYYEFQPE